MSSPCLIYTCFEQRSSLMIHPRSRTNRAGVGLKAIFFPLLEVLTFDA